MNWVLILILAAASLAIGIAGTAAGYPETWAAVGLLIVLFAVAALTEGATKRHKDRASGGPAGDGTIPATHIEEDDDTPLGDTREVHDEITPVDLPPGDPARRALREHPERGTAT